MSRRRRPAPAPAPARGAAPARRRALAPAAALVLAVIAAAPAAAQTPVTGVGPATPIAAYGDRVVWSRPTSAGDFELVQRVGDGAVRAVRVPHRRVPFDVDVGPTAGGHVVAVYSRCATEPGPAPTGGIPAYDTGVGCDLWRVDLAGGREARYAAASATDASEFWPTYWKGRLGFARSYDGRADPPALYVKDLASPRPSERLPGGPATPACRPPVCPRLFRAVPMQLELYGSRLAFVWSMPDEGTDTQLRVDTVGTSDGVVVDRSSSGNLTALLLGWPAFENGRLFWARECFGDPQGCPGRERLSQSTYTGPITELAARSPRYVVAHERAAGVTWVLRDAPGLGGCRADAIAQPAGTCTLDPLRPDYAPRR